jgi:hypothetical protein
VTDNASHRARADFVPDLMQAREAATAEFGERWDLQPEAFIRARLPAQWASVQVVSGKGHRTSRAPRDQKLPIARFWPGGVLPVGPIYEAPASTATPQRKRRPSGIGLPSGFDRVGDDFYCEPRWLVEALVDKESLEGSVLDPFCGCGSLVGVLLARGMTARGSDKYDFGFRQTAPDQPFTFAQPPNRRDAFTIAEHVDNVVSNPPFVRFEDAVRHFYPLVRRKLILLGRLNILEGQQRQTLFQQHPPARVWVSIRRASMPPGSAAVPRDEFGAGIPAPASGGSTAYAWLCWDKAYDGPPVLGWL